MNFAGYASHPKDIYNKSLINSWKYADAWKLEIRNHAYLSKSWRTITWLKIQNNLKRWYQNVCVQVKEMFRGESYVEKKMLMLKKKS